MRRDEQAKEDSHQENELSEQLESGVEILKPAT
jgi:hypothetical protein